jgi:hypothetical protein
MHSGLRGFGGVAGIGLFALLLKMFIFKHGTGKTIVHFGKEVLKDQAKDKITESLSGKKEKAEDQD